MIEATGASEASRAPQARVQQIGAGLAAVERRIAAACAGAGRSRNDVCLVVVTKFFPASDVRALVDLGVTDIGENRDQEAAAKVSQLRAGGTVLPRIHFIGQLQTNKAASVAGYADAVHSLDRVKLARALDRGTQRAGRTLDVLLQVSLDGDTSRGGVAESGVPELARVVQGSAALRLRGLMAVAPIAADPREAFAHLASVHARLLADHPQATWCSAGMSGDLEAAVAAGSTHLRVGSAILGSRPEHD